MEYRIPKVCAIGINNLILIYAMKIIKRHNNILFRLSYDNIHDISMINVLFLKKIQYNDFLLDI